MIRRVRQAVLRALLLAVLLSGCSRAPILIGFAGPLSGSSSDLGVQGRNGATLAIEKINAEGGVHGRPLELIPRDDGNDPDTALSLNEAFRQEGVVAIIGHMTSAPSVAVATLRERGGVPYISPTASAPSLSRRDDYFFRLQGASDRPARVLGAYLVDHVPGARVAVLLDSGNLAYSEPYENSFSDGIGENGVIVYRQFLDIAAIADWTAVLDDLSTLNPEAVLIVASAVDTARFAQALRNAGLDWELLGSGWAATGTISTHGGRAIDGMLVARSVFDLMESEAGQIFRDRYFQRFGREPSFAAAQAYNSVHLLVAALDETNGRVQGLRDTLRTIGEFNTLAGPTTIDAYGDVETVAVVLRYESDTFVPVYHWDPENE